MKIAKSSTSLWIIGEGGTRGLQNNIDYFQIGFRLQVVLKTLLLKTPHTWDAGHKKNQARTHMRTFCLLAGFYSF